MTIAPSVAFNPLTYFHTAEGFHPELAPPLAQIYREIREAGFDAVHAEPPQDMPFADYLKLLSDSGLTPAPGYFQAAFADTDDLPAVLERARRVAGEHAQLGLRRIFIAEQFGISPARVATPGVGAEPDPERLRRITENLGTVAAAMTAEGVQPCLHQHVGTLIETPEETDAVLAGTDPAVLLLGPDTGHLAWAGADPAAFIAQHLDRVGAVHLKDVRQARIEGVRTGGLDYFTANSRHVWTEPGRGDVDFAAVLGVLSRFDGWYVIEVDVADQPTPQDTARVSAEWVRDHLTAPHDPTTRDDQATPDDQDQA